jgi:hypothetical protein
MAHAHATIFAHQARNASCKYHLAHDPARPAAYQMITQTLPSREGGFLSGSCASFLGGPNFCRLFLERGPRFRAARGISDAEGTKL